MVEGFIAPNEGSLDFGLGSPYFFVNEGEQPMILHYVDNATSVANTLVAATNEEIVAAVADRARTIYVLVTGTHAHVAMRRAATVTDIAVPVSVPMLFNLPAGKALNAISAGTPVIHASEVKVSS